MASETAAPLVNDTALTAPQAAAHNLIILGGEHHNTLTANLARATRAAALASASPSDAPIEFFNGSQAIAQPAASSWMRLGSCRLARGDAAVFTYPRHKCLGPGPERSLPTNSCCPRTCVTHELVSHELVFPAKLLRQGPRTIRV